MLSNTNCAKATASDALRSYLSGVGAPSEEQNSHPMPKARFRLTSSLSQGSSSPLNRISSSRLNHAFMISGRSPIAFWNTLPSMGASERRDIRFLLLPFDPESYLFRSVHNPSLSGRCQGGARLGRDSGFEIRNG